MHQANSLVFLISPKTCVVWFHPHVYKEYNVESLLIFSNIENAQWAVVSITVYSETI